MLLKRYGNVQAKKRIWNAEFSSGKWDYLEPKGPDSTIRDPVYNFIQKYSGGGNILDLGCGTGKTGFELDLDRYNRYTGVDVSNIAIERAEAICREIEERAKRNEYFVSDIVSFVPMQRYRIILFRETLYYVSRSRINKMLLGFSKYLDEGGVFIVRMCDQKRYKQITELITKNFRVFDKYTEDGDGMIILVFR